MIRATSLTGPETNPGCPSPAGAITWSGNLLVSMAGWNCRNPSRIHSSPSVTWILRRVTLSLTESYVIQPQIVAVRKEHRMHNVTTQGAQHHTYRQVALQSSTSRRSLAVPGEPSATASPRSQTMERLRLAGLRPRWAGRITGRLWPPRPRTLAPRSHGTRPARGRPAPRQSAGALAALRSRCSHDRQGYLRRNPLKGNNL